MGTIALTNTINVSLTATPSGLSDDSTNTICIFSNEQPLSVAEYIYAVNASEIITEYGSSALTSAMGTAMFMPAPNLITGKGQVIVYPYNATNATPATITSPVINASTLAQLKTIISGDFGINIDSAQYNPTGINMSQITSVADVVTVLNNIGLDMDISVTDNNQILFSSRRVGSTESILTAIEPTESTDGTSGTLTTGNLSTNISNFKSVTNGCLYISVDGISYLVTDIDCNAATDATGLANALTTAFTPLNIPVTISTNSSNELVFTSNTIGLNSIVTIDTVPSGTEGTDLSGSGYLDVETCAEANGTNPTYTDPNTLYPYFFLGATSEAGANAGGTTLAEAVAEASQKFYFGGVVTTQICDNSTILANAQYIQTTDHIYYEGIHSLYNMADLGNSIKTAELGKTRLLEYSTGTLQDMKQAVACYASIASSTNYSGADTALTMNLKTLTGIEVDSNLNQTFYNMAQTNGVDIYGATEGLSCVYSFSNSLYTDEATMNLWLKKALEVAGFNYLRKTNTKIPQTAKGLAGLVNAYENVLKQGVANGCIGTGLSWNDSIPFGDPELFEENIEQFGYYIYHIPISQQSQTERENREAPVIQIALKRSGAIHTSDVIVNIQA